MAAKGGRRKLGWVAIIAIVQVFVIGNVIAWVLGARPIEMPQVPYDADEQKVIEQFEPLAAKKDRDALVALGVLRFLHNDIDAAERSLSQAIAEVPDDLKAQSYYHSVQAKKAGRMLDLSMGIIKLRRLSSAVDHLRSIAAAQPADMVLQINYLATIAAVQPVSDYAARALRQAEVVRRSFESGQWNDAPKELRAAGHLAAAKVYLYHAETSPGQAPGYFLLAKQQWREYSVLGATPPWAKRDADEVRTGVENEGRSL